MGVISLACGLFGTGKLLTYAKSLQQLFRTQTNLHSKRKKEEQKCVVNLKNKLVY